MNPKTQFDIHPDGEVLSAFAERVLTKNEQGEISAHLAICERCRQVVFLAQEAATKEEAFAAVRIGKVGTRSRSWMRSWWFLWAPTAAMAVAIVIALYVHLKRIEPAMEMARATQEASPLAGERPGNAASPTTEVSPAIGVSTGQAVVTANRPPVAPLTHFNSSAFGVKGKVVNGGTEHVALLPGPIGIRQPAPGSVNEFKPQPSEAAGASEPMRAEVMSHADANSNESENRQGGAQEENYGSKVKGSSQAVAAAPPAAVGFTAGVRTTRAVALNAPKVSALPTGLPAISTAKGTLATLAVDETGNVFVSTDNGNHWERVARQWSGRVAVVRAQTTMPDKYELVNDLGQKWVSPDGLVWTAE